MASSTNKPGSPSESQQPPTEKKPSKPEPNPTDPKPPPGSEKNLETMKHLNDRFESYIKTVKSQEPKDKEIMVEILHHGVKEKIFIREETKLLTDVISTLSKEKSELQQEINKLQRSQEMEKTDKEKAEKKVTILMEENERHSKTIATLKNDITKLHNDISILKINKDKEIEHWKTTAYIKPHDAVDSTEINFGDTGKTEFSFETMTAEYKSKIIELQKKVNEKDTELIEARNKIESLSLKIDIQTREIESLKAATETQTMEAKKTEKSYQDRCEKLQQSITELKTTLSTKETDITVHIHKYESLEYESKAMSEQIKKYKKLLEHEESRIKKPVPGEQPSDSAGSGGPGGPDGSTPTPNPRPKSPERKPTGSPNASSSPQSQPEKGNDQKKPPQSNKK